jgi:hypothetical protein
VVKGLGGIQKEKKSQILKGYPNPKSQRKEREKAGSVHDFIMNGRI